MSKPREGSYQVQAWSAWKEMPKGSPYFLAAFDQPSRMSFLGPMLTEFHS